MFKRYVVTFLLVVVSIVVLMGCTSVLPESSELSETEAVVQPANIPQNNDPALLVPESTMGEATERYVQNWDDNPVATVPESTMGESSGQDSPNWDDNPVTTIPESTMSQQPQQYIHNWDDNPVSTIPESTMGK